MTVATMMTVGGKHRDHTDAETLDDDSRSTTGGTGVGDGLSRAVRVRRAELGGFADEDTGDETEDDAAKVPVTLLATVEEDLNAGDGEDNHEDRGGVHTTVEGVEEVGLEASSFVETVQKPMVAARMPKPEIQNGKANSRLSVGKRGARDDGAAEGFEKISTHTGDITDVVTDVVGDRGRVARVIFRNVGFNLTDEIGADVSSLGVDTTRHTREERDGGGTETEAGEVTDSVTHVEVAVPPAACRRALRERRRCRRGRSDRGYRTRRRRSP